LGGGASLLWVGWCGWGFLFFVLWGLFWGGGGGDLDESWVMDRMMMAWAVA